jgi:DNA-binding Lrp family transcriptional regulator
MKGLDVLSRRLLSELRGQPAFDVAALAQRAGCTPAVAEARLAKMRDLGVLRGVGIQLDQGKLGRPHEVLVTGSPSARTDQSALQALCRAAGVTRVFTLASRSSVAFTMCGTDLQDVERKAKSLAAAAGLEEARFTLIVNTLMDDPAHGVADVLPDTGASSTVG